MELERKTSRGKAGGRDGDVKTVLVLLYTRCVVCVGVQPNQCIKLDQISVCTREDGLPDCDWLSPVVGCGLHMNDPPASLSL